MKTKIVLGLCCNENRVLRNLDGNQKNLKTIYNLQYTETQYTTVQHTATQKSNNQ